jgi:hypothetical protein
MIQQNSTRQRRLLAIFQPLITPPRPLLSPSTVTNTYRDRRSLTHPGALTTGCLPHPSTTFLRERAPWKTETFKISCKPPLSRTLQLSASPPKEYMHRGSGNSPRNVQVFYPGITFPRSTIIRYDFDWSIGQAIIYIHPLCPLS